MPLFPIDTRPFDQLSIWKITEDCTYFFNQLQLSNSEQGSLKERFKSIESLRQFLASRHLIYIRTGVHFRDLTKSEKGKYQPINGLHISISHSADWACLSMNNQLNGIDIQTTKPSLLKIAPRFIESSILNTYKQKPNTTDLIYYDWGIKESIYKAYGKGGLTYKKDIQCNVDETVNPAICTLCKEETFTFKAYFTKTDHFYLSYVVQE